MWTLAQAVKLCSAIEAVCPAHGCHVALTGGTLYKYGERKDVDILFYRIRQVERIDESGLLSTLEQLGIILTTRHGWVQKGKWKGNAIDMFFPESDLPPRGLWRKIRSLFAPGDYQ